MTEAMRVYLKAQDEIKAVKDRRRARLAAGTLNDKARDFYAAWLRDLQQIAIYCDNHRGDFCLPATCRL